MGAQAEADRVQIPTAELRMVGLETNKERCGALAGLLGVERRRRVAGQPGQFSPVDDENVGARLLQVGCKRIRTTLWLIVGWAVGCLKIARNLEIGVNSLNDGGECGI